MIHIINGPIGSGKTTLLKRVVSALKAHDVKMTGYLSERILEEGKTIGYDLVGLDDGRSLPFLRGTGEEYWPRAGAYYFFPDGLQAAWTIIRNARESEILVLDEIGPVELEGGGVWPPLKNVLFLPVFRGLFVVRDSVLSDLRAILENRPMRIFDVRDPRSYQGLIDSITNPS